MSEADDNGAFGFAVPLFNAAAALQRVQREMRAMGLAERAGDFERRGVRIARAALEGGKLQVAVVKKPSRNSPEWQTRSLANDADVRQFCAKLKQQLAAWSDNDD
jgi:hypothetical protein